MATELEAFVERLWAAPQVAVVRRRPSPGTAVIGSVSGLSIADRPIVVFTTSRGLYTTLAAYPGLRVWRQKLPRAAVAVTAPLAVRTPKVFGLREQVWLVRDGSRPDLALHEHIAQAASLRSSGCIVIPRHDDGHYKPSLTMVDSATGGITAFAKVSWRSGTHGQIRQEAAALQEIRSTPFRSIQVPALLAAGEYADRPYLVTQALPRRVRQHGRSLPAPELLTDLAGPTTRRPWRASPRHAEFSAAAGLAAERGLRERAELLLRASAALEAAWPDGVAMGRAHGDFVPWNVATIGGRVFVWDWEHYCATAPIGIDAAHWLLLTSEKDNRRGWTAALSDLMDSWRAPPGSELSPVMAAVLCVAELLARSQRVSLAGGVEPYPLDRELHQLLDMIHEQGSTTS